MSNFEIVKFRENNIELDVNVSPDEDTVWLTQDQIALLFGRDRTVILRHISNIFKENELNKDEVCANFAHTTDHGAIHGKTQSHMVLYYNLDVIISVGYRVKSKNGILFRRWANSVLKEYLLKGYSINEKRTLVTNENYINLINKVDNIDSRLKNIENNSQYKKEKIIVNGEIFDALNYLEEIVSRASKNIILVDPYADSKALNILKNSKDNVSIKIITSSKAKLSKIDINTFLEQYNKNINIVCNDKFHDRYLFIDDKVFHLGASINYIGRKISQINEVEDMDIIDYLKKRVGLI